MGCQLVPPVILFSPGWLQCMSLRINRAGVSSSWQHRAENAHAAPIHQSANQPSLTSSSFRFRCPDLESNIRQAAVSGTISVFFFVCLNEDACSLAQMNIKRCTHCRQGWPGKSQGRLTPASRAADWTAGWSRREWASGCLRRDLTGKINNIVLLYFF